MEVFNNLKDIIKKENSNLIVKELSRVKSSAIDTNVLKEYISKQKSVYPFAGLILEHLSKNIKHVSFQQILQDLDIAANNLYIKLNTQKFYIFLSGGESTWSYNYDQMKIEDLYCFSKSNLFLAILLLAFKPELVDMLEDFVCGGKPIYSEILDPKINNYVYVDDVSFSGRQLSKEISTVTKSIISFGGKNVNFFLVVNYVRNSTVNLINGQIMKIQFPISLAWIRNKNIRPEDFNGVADKVISQIKSLPRYIDIDQDIIEHYIRRFVVGDTLNNPQTLFYTDLKVADRASTYPNLFHFPVIIKPDERFEKSLVSNCPKLSENIIIRENQIDMIIDGNFCPLPTYKRKEWLDFVKNNVYPNEENPKKKRKNSR